MGNERQRTYALSEVRDAVVVDIPDGHAIGGHAERIVIGGRRDAADDAALHEAPEAGYDASFRQTRLLCDARVWLRIERKPGLRCFNELAFIGKQDGHAATLKPMKNSSSLGNCRTSSPVSLSMVLAVRSMSASVSVASTNHMFRAWSRS